MKDIDKTLAEADRQDGNYFTAIAVLIIQAVLMAFSIYETNLEVHTLWGTVCVTLTPAAALMFFVSLHWFQKIHAFNMFWLLAALVAHGLWILAAILLNFKLFATLHDPSSTVLASFWAAQNPRMWIFANAPWMSFASMAVLIFLPLSKKK